MRFEGLVWQMLDGLIWLGLDGLVGPGGAGSGLVWSAVANSGLLGGMISGTGENSRLSETTDKYFIFKIIKEILLKILCNICKSFYFERNPLLVTIMTWKNSPKSFCVFLLLKFFFCLGWAALVLVAGAVLGWRGSRGGSDPAAVLKNSKILYL